MLLIKSRIWYFKLSKEEININQNNNGHENKLNQIEVNHIIDIKKKFYIYLITILNNNYLII